MNKWLWWFTPSFKKDGKIDWTKALVSCALVAIVILLTRGASAQVLTKSQLAEAFGADNVKMLALLINHKQGAGSCSEITAMENLPGHDMGVLCGNMKYWVWNTKTQAFRAK
jgi:hypothetical protein